MKTPTLRGEGPEAVIRSKNRKQEAECQIRRKISKKQYR